MIGELPAELDGRYLRNGPNPFDLAHPATHHWFMGDGMVHGVRLRGGRAEWYRNRYVGSTRVARERGHDDFPGPNWSGSQLGPNTNAIGFAGRTWALVEAGGTPVELTDELDSVARNDFSGTLPGGFSAHPKLDPATGELHAMCYAPGWMNNVQYVVVGVDGRVRRTVDIELATMVMVHDMALSQRFAVVYDLPVTLDFDLLGQDRFPFSWNPDHGARLGLLPREGDAADIVWVDVPLAYVFHPMNAFDTPDGQLTIDHCVYDSMFARDLDGPLGDGTPRLERWVLDPVRRTCSTTVLDDRFSEFPRHRDSVATKPYRYGYTAMANFVHGAQWPTVKHDLLTGESTVFDHGPGRCAGEPVFVGRGSGAATGNGGEEDDGWLMTFVHDLRHETAELVVIDAQDFARGYVARVQLPQRVPFGFHGNWVASEPGGTAG